MYSRQVRVAPVRRRLALIAACLAALAIALSLAPGRVALAQSASFIQDQKLTPTDFTLPQPFVQANGLFGASVAMSADGAWMVVGAPAAANPAGIGRAFVYERVADVWTLRTTLSGAAAAEFGASVAVSVAADDLVIVAVGAPGFNSEAGQVQIFVQDAVGSADFTLAATRAPTAPIAGDRFGHAVSLSSATLAVGAPFRTSGTGEVFIFERTIGGANNFGQRTSFTGSEAGEQFGASLGLNQANLAVGAPFAGNGGRVSLRNVDQGGSNSWGETASLTGADTAAGDLFGASVGLSAERVIVGAPGHNNAAGAAYLFDRLSANAQEQKLTATGGAAGNAFGSSVAVLADTETVIGEPGATVTSLTGAGRVHFFSRPAATWTGSGTLSATTPGSAAGLGTAVAISSTGAAAGAPRAIAPGVFDVRTGTLLTFQKPAAAWTAELTLQAQLLGPVLNAAQAAGSTIAAQGDLLAVGAPGDTAYGVGAGAVYLYERNTAGVWVPIGRLATSGLSANADFGRSLAFADATTLYVGAPGVAPLVGALTNTGVVLRYELINNAWVQTRRIESPDPASNARFGTAVAAAGDLLAIGQPGTNQAFVVDTSDYSFTELTPTTANGDFGAAVALYDPDPAVAADEVVAVGQPALNTNQGRVAVFSGASFATETLLAAPAPVADDRFGTAVAAGSDGILVGAPGRTANTGAAWIFSGASFATVTPLTPATPVAAGALGRSVTLSNGSAVIGAPGAGTGRAYAFAFADNAWSELGIMTPADGAAADTFGAAVALAPGAFLVGAPAHTSAAVNDLGAAYAFSIAPEALLSETTLSVSEAGTTDTFTIALNQAPPSNVTVRLTFDNAQLRAGVGTPATGPLDLTFTTANWNTAQTVTVAAVDDAIDEADPHTATITLTTISASSRWNGLTVPSVTVSIADNDTAGVTVSKTTAAVTEDGATDSYTVVLDSEPTANVSVQLAFDAAQLQLNGAGSPLTLTFTAANWDTAQTVTVAAVDDQLVEGSQSYTITQSATSSDANYNTIAVADPSITVTDNDTAAVSFSATTSDAPEGTTPHVVNAQLTLTTSGTGPAELATAVTAPVNATAGTAATPADFTLSTASVTFAAGSVSTATQPINTAIVNDSLVEGAETFALGFGTVTGPATATGAHTVTITDNDTASIGFAGPTGTAAEGTTPYNVNAVLTITSNPAGGSLAAAVNVPITNTPGTAETPADYTSSTSVTFAAGATSAATQPVSVTIVNDQLVEGAETFALGFGTVTGPATASGAHTATITDNDTATVAFSSATGSVNENEGPYVGSAVLTLTTNGTGPAELARAVSVAVGDTPDTAVTPADYTRTTNSVTFAVGAISAATQSVNVTIVDNAVDDGDRTFDLTLGAVTGPATTATPTSQTVTIVDDDEVGVSVSTTTAAVTEDGATDSFTVRLGSQPTADVSIAVSFDNAQLQLNGAGTTVTLTFTPANWDTTQTVAIAAFDDQLVEDAHAAAINFAVNSTDASYNGLTVDPIDVAITDNDSADINLSGPATVDEGGGAYAATLTLTLNTTGSGLAALAIPLDASLETIEDTAEDIFDFSLSTTTATFAAGAVDGATQPVTVSIDDDQLVEGDETFDLQLTAVDTPGAIGTAAEVTVTITDNDSAALSFSAPTASVNEEDGFYEATVVLTLTTTGSGPAELANLISAAIVATPGTAETPADFTLSTTEVSFFDEATSGATETVFIDIVDDSIVEADETFTLEFGAVTGPATASGTHVVTIISDDSAAIDVTSELLLAEGEAGETISVSLSAQPTSDVTVRFTFDNAQVRLNGSAQPVELIFTPANWDTEQTVAVVAFDDALVEASEHTTLITVNVSSADPEYAALTIAPITANIFENDEAMLIFSEEDATVAEDAGTYTATVELQLTIISEEAGATGALTEAISVSVRAVDVTAVRPTDYQLVTTSVTFAAGATNGATQPIDVSIVDNDLVDGDRDFSLEFGDISDLEGFFGFQFVTITDDEVAPPASMQLYLPLMGIVPPSYPDLVVQQIAVVNGVLEVTIANTGSVPVTAPFWVDLYINPRSTPTAVNQIWPTLADRGGAWGVTAPIPAGGSLTLRLGDAYFRPEVSNVGGPIAAGTLIAVQVDSANVETTYGNILESHEASGGAYNNVRTSTLGAPTTAGSSLQQAPANGQLPPREAPPPPGTSAPGTPLSFPTPNSRREQI